MDDLARLKSFARISQACLIFPEGPAERELFTSEVVERRLQILAEGLSLEGKLA